MEATRATERPTGVCPHFHAAIEQIGKRWTGAIVCVLAERPQRFGELGKAGFTVPQQLQELPSNAMKVRHYDQIAFRSRKERLELTGAAGVLDYYQAVFRDTAEDEQLYVPDMMPAYETTSSGKPRTESGKRTYYRTYWRTHQMSDHLPMWVELRIDYSDEYLQRKLDEAS